VLLVASPYDSFLLEEAGELSERVLGEFRHLDLHYGPGLKAVSTGAEALGLIQEQSRFNLVVTTLHLGDMNGAELARRVGASGLNIPVVLLAFDNRELKDFVAFHDLSGVERPFLWQGDARILLAIVKSVEDRLNVVHDTKAVGVQVILLIEDNVRYYSSFLPTIYAELLHHSQRVISEGLNLSQKILRMRARPKILLCGSFEEAWEVFSAYEEDILGVISDVEFPKEGSWSAEAGLDFARLVKDRWPDVPVLLQSSRSENEARAREVGADFLVKGSPVLLNDLRRFILANFGFGDFVFRLPGGGEVDRAADLKSLEEKLHTVPAQSIAYHAERNHFSKWFKARTEFALAHELRPRRMSDFPSIEALRQNLIDSLASYRRGRDLAVVADFDKDSFEGSSDFYRIGGGSLGGKARGLAFVRRLLGDSPTLGDFRGVEIHVPPSVVLATGVFDRFLDENDLRDFAIHTEAEAEIHRRFQAAAFPGDVVADLEAFLESVQYPLAVRSSSLLEDSQYQPFSGVYKTFMLPNNHPFLEVRLGQLVQAVKRVYASTFSSRARNYIRATPYRLEEEGMAVVIQRIVGRAHGSRFYPDFAGVARSYNYYPTPPSVSEDGIVALALGLGRTVVEGSNCFRFSPRHPHHPVAFSPIEEALATSQRRFWAVDLDHDPGRDVNFEMAEACFDLGLAEEDGTLALLASTYSPDNHALYEGVSRPGVRLVSFAPLLKHGPFPLAQVLSRLLEAGSWGMAAPVEIEFAVNLSTARDASEEFGFLQLRPLAPSRGSEDVEIEAVEPQRLICRSAGVLGHGRVDDVRDLLVIDPRSYDRSQSHQTARDLARMNAELAAEGRPFVLIGAGRWGSADPWLGIPVTWDQISGARAIVEAGFADMRVAPSQGTHFFQNLTSFNVGYFTVNPDLDEGFVDWDWLKEQPSLRESSYIRWLRFDTPVIVLMNGRRNQGVILKPSPS